MLEKVISVYKKKGQTPLQAIEALVKIRPDLQNLPLSYAGRLDPLASGVLLILVGDECKKKEEYLALSKEYLVTILFGFQTDTYDVMGKIETAPSEDIFSDETPVAEKMSFDYAVNEDTESTKTFKIVWPSFQKNSARRSEELLKYFGDEVKHAISKFVGTITQSYPPYSSRTVMGKPLFVWAREGRLDEITIPTHEVYVKSIDIKNQSEIIGEKLLEKITSDIALVSGDFRQQEILELWNKVLENKKHKTYHTITLRISCGSGVYVRSISHDIGKMLGTGALALDIIRTKVGEYSLPEELPRGNLEK